MDADVLLSSGLFYCFAAVVETVDSVIMDVVETIAAAETAVSGLSFYFFAAVEMDSAETASANFC